MVEAMMIPRKKYNDFFPNWSKTLNREGWVNNTYRATEKYEIVNSDNSYSYLPDHFPVGKDMIVNFAPDAKVLSLIIEVNYLNQAIITIDFKNKNAFDEFKKACPEPLQSLLTPIESSAPKTDRGLLEKERIRGLDYLPHAQPITYSARITGWHERRTLVDNTILAIHNIDPFDRRTIMTLDKHFRFLKLNNTKYLIETDKDIRKKLNDARARGNGMGLFAQAGYPPEIGEKVLENIKDPNTRLNVELTCKNAYFTGENEVEREAAKINETTVSRQKL